MNKDERKKKDEGTPVLIKVSKVIGHDPVPATRASETDTQAPAPASAPASVAPAETPAAASAPAPDPKKEADAKKAEEQKKKEIQKAIDKKKKEIEQKNKKKRPGSPLFARMSVKEQTHFTKRLSFLVRSGVPMLESLHILRSQFRSRSKGMIMESIIADVTNGQFLSAALARFQNIFGSFSVNIIKVGELSGNLSDNLIYLSEELKKRHALKRKVVGALVYPIIITVATIGISVLLTVFIFPKIMPIFSSLNVHLPFTTRALIFVSSFLREYGLYLLLALILGGIAFFITLKKVPSFHFFVSRTLLRVPLLGGLLQSYNVTNFCRTLSLLLKSGFNVVEAASITAEATANPVYKEQCKLLEAEIVKGERLSKHLMKQPKLFPDMVGHMVLIGETSGNLSDTLYYLSEHFESELDDLIKNLSSAIEPVLMVFMGLIVGFVAVSVITPIYAITQNLSR